MVCITGAASSSLYYQATFGMIGLIDAVLVYAMIPIIKLLFWRINFKRAYRGRSFCRDGGADKDDL